MTPQNKLRIANVLMLAGTVPLLFGIYTLFSIFPIDVQHKSEVADLFMVFGKLVFAYVFALMISGSSGVWSIAVAKRNPATEVDASRNIRLFVGMILVVPFVLTAILA